MVKTQKETKKETKSKKEKKVVTSEKEKNIKITEKKSNIKVLSAVLIALAITVILTWVVTGKYFSNSALSEIKSQVGIFDLLNYPTIAISYFGNIVMYILVIGGFYGVLHKIGAYRELLNRIAKNFNKKSTLFFAIIISLLAIFTSVCGASFGLLIIVPFIVSVILIMGYNKITAVLVTIGSISVGLIGTTLSSTYVTSTSELLAQNGTGILNTILTTTAFDLIVAKILILVVGIVLLIFNTVKYAKNHKTKELINDESYIPIVDNKSKKVWPIVLIIDLVLVITLLSLTSWSSVFKLDIFSKFSTSFLSFSLLDMAVVAKAIIIILFIELIVFVVVKAIKKAKNKNINKKIWLIVGAVDLALIVAAVILTLTTSLFKASFFVNVNKALSALTIFKYPLFGTLLGQENAHYFECWTVVELSGLLLVASIVLAIIYKINYKSLIKNFIEGAKRAIKPAVIVVLIYTILVIVSYKPITLTFVEPLVNKFNVFKMSLGALISSMFNVDLYYASTSILPYAMSKITDIKIYPLISLIWQTMYGLFTLIAPTSVILMVILSYLHVSYKEWLKAAFKFIIELVIIILIVLSIVTIII